MNIVKFKDIVLTKHGWTINGEGFYETEPEVVFHPAIYNFISYDEIGEIEHATGTVEVVGVIDESSTIIRVLTNEPYEEWIGREFVVNTTEIDEYTLYPIYTYPEMEEVSGIRIKASLNTAEYYTIGDVVYNEQPIIEEVDIPDEFFNDNLKGKYVYAVNFLWVFPFNTISVADYVDLSKGVKDISQYTEGEDYVLFDKYIEQVNVIDTEKANSIDKYIYLNSYTTDSDITIDELKKFRTWLATVLLNTEGFVDEFVELHKDFNVTMINAMLNYYKNEMSDSATKFLSLFAPGTIAGIETTSKTTCGCSSNNAALLLGKVNVCDPLFTYMHEIYKYMVKCFSEIEFWDNEYLRETIDIDFKNYIDNIIKVNLPLTSSTAVEYEDCTCLNTDSDMQKRYQAMLSKLSTSLGYIINNEISSHKNFIANALVDWATYLYEKMRWN